MDQAGREPQKRTDPTNLPALPFQLQGVALFLFIPFVLFLFVRHPAPVGLSLLVGLAIMVLHRRLARPYMQRAIPIKCIWCNRLLMRSLDQSSRTLDLQVGGELLPVRACTRHYEPARRFLAFLWAGRWPFRVGIFLPLAFLLLALGAAAFGLQGSLAGATAWFRVLVGVTVNVAALGPWVGGLIAPRSPIPTAFPVHNLYLLGARQLLWIFRIVGVWWIVLFWLSPLPPIALR
jgi:hypothetical protein